MLAPIVFYLAPMAGKYTIPPVTKGDTWDGMTLTVTDGVTGDPLDLTGASVRMMLRKHPEDTQIVKEFSTATGEIIITPPETDGKIDFLGNREVMDIPAYNYHYDIEVTFASGRIFTYMRGRWYIKQDVTY